MNKIAFIFPGQGAQYVGMAKEFYDAFPVVRETFQEASDLLSFDFTKLILEGPENDLIQTKNSQPAIFVVSCAILRCLQQQFPDLKPTVCAGLSLGEYTALYAAGLLTFSEALKLVAARGNFMQEACLEKAGTMRVALGLELSKITLPQNVWIANLNCPGQVVIAGSREAMPQAEELLKAQGAKRVLPLDVSGAFHTPFMKSAQDRLKPMIQSANFQTGTAQIVMNVPGSFVASSAEMRDYLIAQVASPTYWEKGIRAIDEQGIDLYIEIGPGKTLTGMNKKIGVKGQTIGIEKTADLQQLEQFYATSQR